MSQKSKIDSDSKLLLLKYLYHEDINPVGLYELLKDPMTLEEYEALKVAKNQLDSSCSHRMISPPDDVVAHIFTKAHRKSIQDHRKSVFSVRRLSVIGGIGAALACALIFVWIPRQEGDSTSPEQHQTIENSDLQWDDTRDRIEIQQALRIVRQRTSPDLWDESDVMKLDSLSDLPTTILPGIKITGSTSQ